MTGTGRGGDAGGHPADRPVVGSVGSLLFHAYVIEAEAEARYLDLAEQMEAHNNPKVAALFRQLAEYEGKHAAHIETLRPATPRPPLDPWDFSWIGQEAPESLSHLDMHYQLTVRQALELSLAAEKAAYKFFNRLADETEIDEVRLMAKNFADEELEHVGMIERALQEHAPASEQTADDWDPPVDQG